MSEPLDRIAWTRQWVEKAEADLQAAERLHAQLLPLSDIICFHAQQCAEKYAKALLAYRMVPFPRTHDLVILLRLIRESGGIEMGIGDITVLNRYSTEVRYPGGWERTGREDAESALAVAREIRKAVRRLLPREATGE